MSEEVIKILNYLGEKMGVTIDWTNNNVIPYIEQLCGKFIKWEISTSIAWLVIGVLVIVLGIVLGICAGGFEDEMGFMFCFFLIVIGLAVVGFQVFDIIECNVFPEKVLYDYIRLHLKQS